MQSALAVVLRIGGVAFQAACIDGPSVDVRHSTQWSACHVHVSAARQTAAIPRCWPCLVAAAHALNPTILCCRCWGACLGSSAARRCAS